MTSGDLKGPPEDEIGSGSSFKATIVINGKQAFLITLVDLYFPAWDLLLPAGVMAGSWSRLFYHPFSGIDDLGRFLNGFKFILHDIGYCLNKRKTRLMWHGTLTSKDSDRVIRLVV